MKRILENIKKIIEKIIEKIKKFAQDLKLRLSGPAWDMLEKKIDNLIEKDPAYFRNCKIIVPVLPDSDKIVELDTVLVDSYINYIDEMVDQLVRAVKTPDPDIQTDTDSYYKEYNDILKALRTQYMISEKEVNVQLSKMEATMRGEGDTIVVNIREANGILHRSSQIMVRNMKIMKNTEAKLNSSIRRVSKYEKLYGSEFISLINGSISLIGRVFNSIVRLSQAQVTSIVSQYKQIISQYKSSKSQITNNTTYTNNPNDSEVQKTVSVQNRASKSQKKHGKDVMNESTYSDLLHNINNII